MLQVPTLMIWGNEDQALSSELAKLTANDVTDYRYEYVDGGSHWVQQDKPKEVNEHIRKFVFDGGEAITAAKL